MLKSDRNDIDKWSRYWSDGRIAACMAEAGGSYGDLLGAQWRQWFGQLPATARVLDLATGNGALIHLALASEHGARLQLFGVDYAAIEPWQQLPDTIADRRRVRFYGHTNIEQLPFAAGMFDAVVSQYGAEYAEPQATVAEAVRVLADGGQLRWICHHVDSTVYRNTRREIEHARFALQQAQPDLLLEKLLQQQIQGDQFIEQSHQRTADTPQRQALNAALQACMYRLRESTPNSDFLDLLLQNLGYIYQHRESYAPAMVLQKLAEVRVEMEVFLGRMQALAANALDPGKLSLMLQRLAAAGMRNGDAELVRKSSGDIIGIAITAHKSSARAA